MNRAGYFVAILLMFFCVAGACAQVADNGVEYRILVLLNGSGKMQGRWSDKENKYQVASRVVNAVIDSLYQINEDVAFGLRVFGHRHSVGERDCYDTKREVMFSKDTRVQMALRLKDIRPVGLAPTGFALKEATKYDIVPGPLAAYSLIIVTDGSNDCNDDICITMNELKKQLSFTPYVLYIGGDEGFRSAHSCLGEYLTIKNEEDIRYAVGHIVETYRKILPPKKPAPVVVKKRVQELPASRPKPVPKEEVLKMDTLKTGRIARAEPEIKFSKNSRIKAGDGKTGYVYLLNISNIGHIAIVPIDSLRLPGKDVFPVGLDMQRVELAEGKYRMAYYIFGRAMTIDFRVYAGDTTEVWLAR